MYGLYVEAVRHDDQVCITFWSDRRPLDTWLGSRLPVPWTRSGFSGARRPPLFWTQCTVPLMNVRKAQDNSSSTVFAKGLWHVSVLQALVTSAPASQMHQRNYEHVIPRRRSDDHSNGRGRSRLPQELRLMDSAWLCVAVVQASTPPMSSLAHRFSLPDSKRCVSIVGSAGCR